MMLVVFFEMLRVVLSDEITNFGGEEGEEALRGPSHEFSGNSGFGLVEVEFAIAVEGDRAHSEVGSSKVEGKVDTLDERVVSLGVEWDSIIRQWGLNCVIPGEAHGPNGGGKVMRMCVREYAHMVSHLLCSIRHSCNICRNHSHSLSLIFQSRVYRKWRIRFSVTKTKRKSTKCGIMTHSSTSDIPQLQH